jgi:hypothetical protein
MHIAFTYCGVDYSVSGWLWSSDGDSNGTIIRRVDGQEIPGAEMHPGMVQFGVPDAIQSAAESAMRRQMKREGGPAKYRARLRKEQAIDDANA